MQADPDLTTGMIVHTNGFSTSGDGKAAWYKIKSSGTANGSTILALQNSLKAIQISENDSIATADIQDSAVTSAKIADDSVITTKILDNAVTTTKIADDSVTANKLADDAINAMPTMSTSIRGVAKIGAGLAMNGDALELDGSGDIATAVTSWLNAHPEATTTVQDGSITDEKLEPNGILSSVKSITNSHVLTRSSQGAANFDCNISVGDILHLKSNSESDILVRLRENSETSTFLQVITLHAGVETYVKATTDAGNITCFFYGNGGSIDIEFGSLLNINIQNNTNTNNIANIQNDIYHTYTAEDAVDGYCNEHSTNIATSNVGKLLVIPVEAGNRYHINVKIYGYMGAYNITDEYGAIIMWSTNENFGNATVHKVYDEVITIPSGGKLLYLSSETSYGLTAKQMPVIENVSHTLENASMFRYLYPSAICIGDSTTQGVGYTRQYFTYPIFLGKIMQADVTNAGESSTGAKMWWNSHHGEYDYSNYYMAIINLGTNYGLTDTLDADTISGDYTTYADTNTGKYCAIIEEILDQNPNCNIFLAYPQCRTGLVESDETMEETNLTITCSVIDQIAEKYNLDVLDDRIH